MIGTPTRAPTGPRVFKFGGTSVADAERIGHVARQVAAEPGPVVVVVSALAGATDALVGVAGALRAGGDVSERIDALAARHRDVARALARDADDGASPLEARLDEALAVLGDPATATLPPAELEDRVRACGEDLSAELVAFAVGAAGREARVVDARELVRTDAHFGRAVPDEEAIRELARARLGPLLDRGVVPIVQGFVGATDDGRTTTLGRGGSDLSAILLGAALEASEVHIWTDVDGILSGDPRAVAEPRILDVLGFEEAVELAYFGAKVLHPGAAKHAVAAGLAVRIRNSFRPQGAGTLVLRDRWGGPEIAAVAYKPGVALIQVRSHPRAMPYGFLARVFEILARHRVPVDLVATSHTSTAFTLDSTEEIDEVARELESFAEVELRTGLATITVIGHGLLEEPETNALVFRTVAHTPVHLISQASDVSLSFVVDEGEAPDLVRRLHETLIESRDEGRAPGPEGARVAAPEEAPR